MLLKSRMEHVPGRRPARPTAIGPVTDGLEGIRIVLPGFLCKPEIGKEDKSAKRSGPTGKLQWDGMCRISVPKCRRILVHEIEVGVDLGPTMPRDDSIGVCVGHNLVNGEWKSEDNIGDGKGH